MAGWIVKVAEIRGTYPTGYFPRKTHYKSDAQKIATEAKNQGCKGIEIEKIK